MKDTMRHFTITIEAPGDSDDLGTIARSAAQQVALAGWPPDTQIEVDEHMPIDGGGTTALCLGAWTVA